MDNVNLMFMVKFVCQTHRSGSPSSVVLVLERCNPSFRAGVLTRADVVPYNSNNLRERKVVSFRR